MFDSAQTFQQNIIIGKCLSKLNFAEKKGYFSFFSNTSLLVKFTAFLHTRIIYVFFNLSTDKHYFTPYIFSQDKLIY